MGEAIQDSSRCRYSLIDFKIRRSPSEKNRLGDPDFQSGFFTRQNLLARLLSALIRIGKTRPKSIPWTRHESVSNPGRIGRSGLARTPAAAVEYVLC